MNRFKDTLNGMIDVLLIILACVFFVIFIASHLAIIACIISLAYGDIQPWWKWVISLASLLLGYGYIIGEKYEEIRIEAKIKERRRLLELEKKRKSKIKELDKEIINL